MTRWLGVRALGLAAVVAVAALVFFAVRTTTADAHSTISNVQCSVSPQPIQPNTPEEATCTFDFNSSPHTLVVDFSFPPLNVTSCTLDGTAISVGPCP